MKMLIICFLSGAAAGVGTGFAGLSASTVISPMLIAFLGCPWYEAVGIGLASDVLASAFSAYIYRKNNNIDVKNGLYMVIAVLIMTVVGSYFSQYMPNNGMSWFSIILSCAMGVRFIAVPVREYHLKVFQRSEKIKKRAAIVCGCVIGFYCGFLGVGGGLLMLFILTFVLGYELKTAVGTSVFVMTFTALTGAASHFYFGNVRAFIIELLLCAAFTLIGAIVSSYFANKMKPSTTSRITGVILVILGVCMILEMMFPGTFTG